MQLFFHSNCYVCSLVHVKCYFLWRAHSPEQATIARVLPFGSHYSAEFTEVM